MPLSGDLDDIYPFCLCLRRRFPVVNIYDETLPAKRFKSRQEFSTTVYTAREFPRMPLVYLLIVGEYFVNHSYWNLDKLKY